MRQYKVFALLLAFVPVVFACEDYLDQSPDMGLTAETVYADYYSFKGAVDRANLLVHNYVHDRFDYGREIGTMSDECQSVNISNDIITRGNTGDWFNWNGPGFQWTMGTDNEGIGKASNTKGDWEFMFRLSRREVPAEASVGIRACNQILENQHYLSSFPKESAYTEEQLRSQLIGQTYFLRAWFYFMLIRDFGGMPSLHQSFESDANFDVQRPEYWESNEWVINDLDSAIKYLPENWDLTKQVDAGRVTKTSAKAVKAMALLYAASPHYVIPRDESLNFSGTPTYDTEKAKTALAASIEALRSALSAETRYRWVEGETEYKEIFRRQGKDGISDAAIFQPYVSNASVNLQGANTGTAWYLPNFDGGWKQYVVPTQNAVDWFETKDGYRLDDAAQSDAYDPADPYAYRDPRLKHYIFCHGDKMLFVKNKSSRGGCPPNLEADQPNGQHYKWEGSNNNLTFSGYYHAGKFRWPGNNVADNTGGYIRTFAHIRFAQLYLDFAELANEIYGPNGNVPNASGIDVSNAVEAINKVRTRVGVDMPPVKDRYKTSKETFRNYIREERARELFSEQHRWWDLKRWRIAHEVLKEGVYGAYITEDGNGGFNYGKVKIGTRIFENKHYWYPFPSSSMDMMSKFEQNPGW